MGELRDFLITHGFLAHLQQPLYEIHGDEAKTMDIKGQWLVWSYKVGLFNVNSNVVILDSKKS